MTNTTRRPLARLAPSALPASLAALFAALLLLGCGGESGEATQSAGAVKDSGGAKALSVALIFDEGGLGDRSFNDMAHEGVQRGKKEFG